MWRGSSPAHAKAPGMRRRPLRVLSPALLVVACSSAEPASPSAPRPASTPRPILTTTVSRADAPAPEPDRDRDGFPDSVDACPDAQPKRCCPDFSDDPGKRGCPVSDCELGAWGNPFRHLFPSVAFAEGSAALPADATKLLDAAAAMAENLERLELSGHAAAGEKAPNELGRRRAEAVAAALRARNLGFTIAVTSAGSERPIASNDTEKGRAENRRVEIEPAARRRTGRPRTTGDAARAGSRPISGSPLRVLDAEPDRRRGARGGGRRKKGAATARFPKPRTSSSAPSLRITWSPDPFRDDLGLGQVERVRDAVERRAPGDGWGVRHPAQEGCGMPLFCATADTPPCLSMS